MAGSRAWFETVAQAQQRAERRVPRSVYYAVLAGAEQGATLRDNTAAFGELGFLPRIATGTPAPRDQATTVLGQAVSLPVVISPVGAQAVHAAGELAGARAAAAAGTAMGLSSFASQPLEEVVEANPLTFFQVYWLGDRDRILQVLERARDAGAKGIILTLDWSFAHRRDWGSPPIPDRLDWRAMLRHAPEVLRRPRWLVDHLRQGLPHLTVPNLAEPGKPAPTFFGAYGEWMQTRPPTWSDVAWMREQWDGPFAIKGVMHADDARRAVDAGADAISVSNHGGNNLDGTPASIRALPTIAGAVGEDIEILLDGGIRRGSDVVKALALGARAVMVGRAFLWALAANGETGVANLLDILRSGIDETLGALGKASIHELSPADLIVPADFSRGHWHPAPPPKPEGPPGPLLAVPPQVPGGSG
jgi:L-lactate dehydrogenase (cytochrome)